MMGYRHGPKRACQRNIRPKNPPIKCAFANAKPWGPVCFIPNLRKWASIIPHDRPGVRLAPSHARAIFMRGGNPNPIQNNRGKQGMSVHTPAKRLLETGPQTPEKDRQRRPFHRHYWAAARPADASKHEGHTFFSSRSSLLSYSARKSAWPLHLWSVWQGSVSSPCRGIGGLPNKRIFGEIASAYALALLATIENN